MRTTRVTGTKTTDGVPSTTPVELDMRRVTHYQTEDDFGYSTCPSDGYGTASTDGGGG